jgi:alkanesulfonate monooxygenase SsuD/methylene tetrahydromethanopterin reductase-like flavin-dependent oxidoreductase (luciferase family)
VHEFLKVTPGRPLTDIRRFVESLDGSRTTGGTGAGGPVPMPPVVLATLRHKMVQLASEIGQGVIWANGARSHMPNSLEHLTPEQRTGDDFFIGNMIPTVVSDDREAAKAVLRRLLNGYVRLPNYRNYWKEAGYEEEMRAIEAAIAAGEDDRVPALMTDRWLADVTLSGSATEVRDGVEAWRGAGVKTPILVPSSTNGGQFKAVEELFAAFGG